MKSLSFIERIKVRRIGLWSVILNGVQICVYILGVGLSIWILLKIGSSIATNTWPPPIEKIASWSQLIIAYAAIFAIGQYAVAYADISDRKTKTVLEFVKFFRESVITTGDKIKTLLKRDKLILPTIYLRKGTPPFKFTEEEFLIK